MQRISMSRRAYHLLVGLLLTLPQIGWAVTTVTVKVTIVEPPCTINDDRPIEVDFGDVMTTKVDGKNYRIPVAYTLNCDMATNKKLELEIQGTGAPFNNKILQTNITGLGIEIQWSEGLLPINIPRNFTYPNKMELWAVPVKQSDISLKGGAFSASATMKISYL